MRKYSYDRYIPYIRTRYRYRTGLSVQAEAFIRKLTVLFRIVICVIFLAAAFGGIGKNFSEAVDNISEYKAAQLVNEYIDRGVLSASEQYQQKNFVLVGYNSDGTVTSVEVDAIEVNRFAALLSESIQKEIKEREHEKIKVPLGSVTGKKLLSSLGLSIPYRIIPEGKVSVTPESVFQDVGINQTVHKLKMNVSVKVKILFPLVNKEESIDREIIVSETVIVGDVPEMLISKEQ